MDEIINEIKEVLKISPARFSKIFYRAIIEIIGKDNIKVTIISSLDFITNIDFVISYNELDVLTYIEKWNATGLAIGCLEQYLDDKKLNYITMVSTTANRELFAEININV